MKMGRGCAEEIMGDNESRDGGRYDHMLWCTCMDFSRIFKRSVEP